VLLCSDTVVVVVCALCRLIFALHGGPTTGNVETVLIPMRDRGGSRLRYTACLSSQVGCAMNCQVCLLLGCWVGGGGGGGGIRGGSEGGSAVGGVAGGATARPASVVAISGLCHELSGRGGGGLVFVLGGGR
jgi:hypothetical protein